MQARAFHFQVGRTKLGWFGKAVLAVIAVALTALLLTFGLVAATVGVLALVAAKVVRALGGGQRANSDTAWERRVEMQAGTSGPGTVREVEVEVLRIEERPGGPV